MRRLGILLAGALVALLALAPVAGAHGKRHGKTVCGIVDGTSTASALVLQTGGTMTVTIQNTNNVAIPETVGAGADVCAQVRRVRNADGTKSKVLVSVAMRAAAKVEARGPVTVNADGTITVATLTFTLPAGMTLPTGLVTGNNVRVKATAETAGGPLVITKLRASHNKGHHGRGAGRHGNGGAGRHGNGGGAAAWVAIAGRVGAITPATATTAGSIEVGGITLAVPAGKVLRAKVATGAFANARAKVVADALTLKKIKIRSLAPAVPAPV